MPAYQMEVLTNTLKKYQRLESLPLCCFETTKGGNRELCIIDGHHRVRAAIAAQLPTAFVLVIEKELTRQEIVSRQLAHNAITGYDEQAMLADLLAEVTDKQLRYDTGLDLIDLKEKRAPLDDIKPTELLPAEVVVLFFAPEDRAKWKQALELLALKTKDAKEVQVASLKDFDEFSRLIREVC